MRLYNSFIPADYLTDNALYASQNCITEIDAEHIFVYFIWILSFVWTPNSYVLINANGLKLGFDYLIRNHFS